MLYNNFVIRLLYNICIENFTPRIMKRQRWSPIPPILPKRTTNSHLKLVNIEKITTYDVDNPKVGLGQEHTCGGFKLMH